MSLLLAFRSNRKVLINWKNQRMLEKRKYTYFRGLRVKARVANLQKYPNQGFFVVILFMVTFSLKMVSSKSVSTSDLSFVNH